jgi:hypothetical protein
MHYRDLPVTGEDDLAYAGQGYDKAAHAAHLKTAQAHAREAARCLRRALDLLDNEGELPAAGDPGPMDFGDEYDNPETERARMAALGILRALA